MFYKKIYLYEEPFVKPLTKQNYNDYILDYFNDNERQDEEKLKVSLLQFALNEGLIEPSNIFEGKYIPSTESNTGSWKYVINWTDFRSLVDINIYSRLISSLSSEEGQPLSQLINLHTQLGIFYERKFLNTIITRTLNSIQIIPCDLPTVSYEGQNKSLVTNWDRIHIETPFVWLVIYLQMIIKAYASKLK